MKKALFSVAVLTLVFVVITTGAQADMLMGVKPATQVQSSYFGFLVGSNMVLEFGLDLARLKVETTNTGPGFSRTEETSANLYMPHGGVKIFFRPRATGQVSPYGLVDVFKAFSSVTLEDNAAWIDQAALDAQEELTKEVLSPFGFNLAFGAEYYFSESFSMGGEYGLRYLMSKGEAEYTDAFGDTWKTEVSTNLGLTYAAICLNFLF
jgi:opacity protein-like surface antigen